MLESHQVEELICLVATMDRQAITRQFMSFRGTFPVDFTPDFLAGLSVDRLRHIFVALCLQAQRLPEMEEAEAVGAAA